jgi:hypothetical protein
MADDFSKEVRENWKQAEFADRNNRDEALADLAFAAPDSTAGHWDPQVREYRERMGIEKYGFPLPCLTINTLPQFIGQVIGDRRANATSIKVLPREDGDVTVAEVREELIRSIELQSHADRVYASTFEQSVTCGIGNFRVDIDYAYEDAFERDLFVRSIANPLAVLWDPLAADPTGRDATFCFVSDTISKEDYKRRFKSDPRALELDAKGTEDADWFQNDAVRIAEYHKIEEKERTIALMMDGSVRDVTDQPEKEWKPALYRGIEGTEEPHVRKAKCKYATMVLTNGYEELSDPLELKLHRLPIIRAMGRETWIGNRRVRFGLVRYARDSARMRDVMRSIRMELLLLHPRANFVAPAAAVLGREGDWKNCLVYNDDSPAPPMPVTGQNLSALLAEEQIFSQDLKDTTGIHEASLGMQGNETSGRAIMARQHEGDIATIIYHDNMNAAMQEAGEVLNALIPIVYDTARTIRTVGPDEAVKLIRVNDPDFQPNRTVKDYIPNLALGRYDVTISTGPAYMTKRQQDTDRLMTMMQSPLGELLAQTAPDLVVQGMDIPHADTIGERFKRVIPPQVLGSDANDNKTPEEIQQDQQKAAEADAVQKEAAQLEMDAKRADTAKTIAEARKADAEARRAEAEAEKAEAEVREITAEQMIAGAHMAETAANDIPSGDMAA